MNEEFERFLINTVGEIPARRYEEIIDLLVEIEGNGFALIEDLTLEQVNYYEPSIGIEALNTMLLNTINQVFASMSIYIDEYAINLENMHSIFDLLEATIRLINWEDYDSLLNILYLEEGEPWPDTGNDENNVTYISSIEKYVLLIKEVSNVDECKITELVDDIEEDFFNRLEEDLLGQRKDDQISKQNDNIPPVFIVPTLVKNILKLGDFITPAREAIKQKKDFKTLILDGEFISEIISLDVDILAQDLLIVTLMIDDKLTEKSSIKKALSEIVTKFPISFRTQLNVMNLSDKIIERIIHVQ